MNIEKIKEYIKQTGLIIRARRRDLSMSNVQLAEMCCLSPEYIAEVECGVRVPSYTALKRISKALQTSPDIILLGVRLHPPHYADKKTWANVRRFINVFKYVSSMERKSHEK